MNDENTTEKAQPYYSDDAVTLWHGDAQDVLRGLPAGSVNCYPVAARLLLDIDHEGRARVHEAVLAQLLHDAGWERTA